MYFNFNVSIWHDLFKYLTFVFTLSLFDYMQLMYNDVYAIKHILIYCYKNDVYISIIPYYNFKSSLVILIF